MFLFFCALCSEFTFRELGERLWNKRCIGKRGKSTSENKFYEEAKALEQRGLIRLQEDQSQRKGQALSTGRYPGPHSQAANNVCDTRNQVNHTSCEWHCEYNTPGIALGDKWQGHTCASFWWTR